ncbi:hypothetical protein Tco_1408555 [Tanacetum coccineum]
MLWPCRNFKKVLYFKKKGLKFVKEATRGESRRRSFRQRYEIKRKSDSRNDFMMGRVIPNHLIGDCTKHLATKIKRLSLEVLGAIVRMTPKTKPTTKTVLIGTIVIMEVCLRTYLGPDEWIKVSGCSKHMTGNKSLFSTYKAYDGGNIVFGSNLKGKIIGKSTISNDSLTISNKAFEKFEILSRKIQNQLGSSIMAIRMDHGREFDNEVQFGAYCDA